ncbi:MAG: MlaE family ABC transporter permease [Thauera sp.]
MMQVLEVDGAGVSLHGDWTLRGLAPHLPAVRHRLAGLGPDRVWSLKGIERLDSFGATLIWRAWGRRWPSRLEIDDTRRATIARIAHSSAHPIPLAARARMLDTIPALGFTLFEFAAHVRDFVTLLGTLLLDLLHLLRHPRRWPLLEISATVHKVGVKALPVSALVGFLIGVVLSYLSSLQLKTFGADVFIVDILGMGIIRELGPVLVSVLVAGRSGSAMTAQLGVMRVTEEIDALAAMGVSRSLRLVLPKVLGLTLAMPLLVLWTSAIALFGGWVSAWVELDLSFQFFVSALPDAVPVANVYIGLSKGAVFGLLIALIACHFGLRVQPDTESLSSNTTASVVSAITVVILVDAVFAIATRSVGLPV